MTTRRTRAAVSLAAAITASLALAACAGAPSRPAMDGAAAVAPQPTTVRFDNDALEPVDVYLLVDEREWLLGRVGPGGRSSLRVPTAALSRSSSFVQLAVVTIERGVPLSPLSPRGGPVTLSISQPPSAILSQRWTFAEGQIRSLRLSAARVGAGRP